MTPLAEDCGLVEWVNNLGTLRHTVQEMLLADGLYDKSSNSKVKKMYDQYPAVSPRHQASIIRV